MTRLRVGIWIAVLAIPMPPAFAEAGNGPWERFSLGLGGFAANLSNDARVGTPGTGVQIDIGEALGMDSSDTVCRVNDSVQGLDIFQTGDTISVEYTESIAMRMMRE